MFAAICLGFTILLLLHSQLYLWGSPYFFCIPSYIPGIHHTSSSPFPAISLRFTILILHSQLYLWGSPYLFCIPSYIPGDSSYFFISVPSYISGVRHTSSSEFPAISLGFTTLLLLRSQLYLWGSPYFFFCVPSFISGVHHTSSSVFPAISQGFNITILLLRSELCLWDHHFG